MKMKDANHSLPFNQDDRLYADVILPLAVQGTFTYVVPAELQDQVDIGMRVEVPVKRKRYAGVINAVHTYGKVEAKQIISLIDDEPIVTPVQLSFWSWLASYYCCTIGEVMSVVLPTGLKLSSETKIAANPYIEQPDIRKLNTKEYLILEALKNREEITIEEIRSLIKQKTVYPIIKKLLSDRLVFYKEELIEKYKPKMVDYIQLTEAYQDSESKLNNAFDLVQRSSKQTEALLALVQLSKQSQSVAKSAIYEMAKVNSSVIKALEKKGIITITSKQVNRLELVEKDESDIPAMSEAQQKAYHDILQKLETKETVLLHGITGSGKTRIYIEMIQDVISRGGQVLYLLPEIGLTTQMVSRMQTVFGTNVAFYHSKMNVHERVELWSSVMQGQPIVLGARSGLLLPFQNLELIIVDEEHDPSYKQQDPNPRYNARDAALVLGQMCSAKVILGTATPSLESLLNTTTEKYGYVHLDQRFGKSELPELKVVNIAKANKKGELTNNFSSTLIQGLQRCLDHGEQAILFQNRRGYAPILKCYSCGWNAHCKNCDVSMTIHQYQNELRCHYCGYRTSIPMSCPSCSNIDLRIMGFGTEKIEADIKEMLPSARVARMDHDTVRNKNSHSNILNKLEKSEIDILIGTQMVTKGLDFDQLTLVGIINADSLLNFPDFRATERAFHLLTQVSGRAGRREKPGTVIIQTFKPHHTTIRDVVRGDYSSFAHRELSERREFKYPPYYRLISITLKHKERKVVTTAAHLLSKEILPVLGSRRVMGPVSPYIERIRGQYLQSIIIKLEKNNEFIKSTKSLLLEKKIYVKSQPGMSSVRINIDVDPY